jgi:hypothetical protein
MALSDEDDAKSLATADLSTPDGPTNMMDVDDHDDPPTGNDVRDVSMAMDADTVLDEDKDEVGPDPSQKTTSI